MTNHWHRVRPDTLIFDVEKVHTGFYKWVYRCAMRHARLQQGWETPVCIKCGQNFKQRMPTSKVNGQQRYAYVWHCPGCGIRHHAAFRFPSGEVFSPYSMVGTLVQTRLPLFDFLFKAKGPFEEDAVRAVIHANALVEEQMKVAA